MVIALAVTNIVEVVFGCIMSFQKPAMIWPGKSSRLRKTNSEDLDYISSRVLLSLFFHCGIFKTGKSLWLPKCRNPHS